MSYELAAILVVGVLMGLAQAAAIVTAVSGFGALAREMEQTRIEVNRGFEAMDRRLEEISRTYRVIAALIVQESEKIQGLLHP